MLLPLAALAARAQDISLEAVTAVEAGKEDPSVTFTSRVDGRIRASLGCGGRTFSLDTGVRPGSRTTLALKGLPMGPTKCEGQLRLDQPSGAWAEMPLSFDVSVLATLAFEVRNEDVDLKAKTLTLHPSRPIAEGEIELVGVGGVVLEKGFLTLVDRLQPSYRWTTDEEVLKMVVVAADESGIRARLDLSPWFYAIPHEDVVFASGSSEITQAEGPKLERCWAEVERVLAKYGSVVDIELFVAGYTDTVGSAEMNQGLSERRARAIAQWFQRRGFPGTVWYQGFGESALALPTPDETDAQPNRRALYVLAAQAPPASADLPRADWKRP